MFLKIAAAAALAASLAGAARAADTTPPPSPFDTKLIGEMTGVWSGPTTIGGVPVKIKLVVMPGGTATQTQFQEFITPASPIQMEAGVIHLLIHDQVVMQVTTFLPPTQQVMEKVPGPPFTIPVQQPIPHPIDTMWNVKFLTPKFMVLESQTSGVPTIMLTQQ